jgi:class 3 adenylate cyclase
MTLVSQERAILFADVSDSTGLYEKLGDMVAARTIEGCLGLMSACVEEHGGRVVKKIGDEVMAVFPKPDAACDAARQIQQRFETFSPPAPGIRLAVRIGFHFGPVLEDKTDLWGDGVNTASRLATLAKSGQILTSEGTVKALPSATRASARDLRELNVKGKQDAVRVFEILWDESVDSTQLFGATLAVPSPARLLLRLGGRTLDFPRNKTMLSLGRDTTCDVVLREKAASRRHARIERRGGQHYLVDESTNGTYVKTEGDREVHIRRDQVMLRGRGEISFGVSASAAEDLLSFECE